MKKLTKEQLKNKDAHGDELDGAQNKLQKAIAEYNEVVDKAWSIVEAAKNNYNEVVAGVEDFKSDIVAMISDYRDEKLDKWQEGEVGEA